MTGRGDGDVSVVELFRDVAQRRRSTVAFHDGDESITYGELWERICRFSTGLRARGFGPEGRAIVMVPMSIDLYVVLLGALKTGGIALFLDPWVGLRQLLALARFSSPTAFVGTAKSHLLRWFDGGLRGIPLTVSRHPSLLARESLRSIESSEASEEIWPSKREDTALVTFTTGSSGTPKGVRRTHGILAAQHRALAKEFPAIEGDVDLCSFPVFALNNLALGVTTVIPPVDLKRIDRADPRAVIDAMRRHGVTTATASPPLFDAIAAAVSEATTRIPRSTLGMTRSPLAMNFSPGERLERDCHPERSEGSPEETRALQDEILRFAQDDRRAQNDTGVSNDSLRLRRMLSGGAPVDDSQLRKWRAAFHHTEIEIVYGSTEAEPVAHLSAEERFELADSPGYPAGSIASSVRAAIVGISSTPLDGSTVEQWQRLLLPDGEIGELIVTGEHVCRDYERNPEAVRENKIRDPEGNVWHRMGDTGWLDGERRFHLAGRVHSTIFRDGSAIHPQIVEKLGRKEDERIRRIAATGVPHVERGERLVVVIESDADLRDEVTARLKAGGIIADAVLTTRAPMPVDPRHNSKIDYARLREMIEKGSFE